MSALWTSEAIAHAVGGTARGTFVASGVSIDSRAIAKGDLFVALKGPNFDGADFVESALAQGAAGAITTRVGEGPLILVPDTLAALEALGRASRTRTKAAIVAVTGSVGKTSTKEMLRLALTPFGSVHASAGNLNNHWGAPLSLARMPEQSAFGIFELGMNHAGEIAPLSRLVRPHVAIVTEVAAAHLAFFDSVAAIARAKAEIFAGMEGGAAILPADNPHLAILVEGAQRAGITDIRLFGTAEHAAIRLLDCAADPAGQAIRFRLDGRDHRFTMRAHGAHLARNALAVIGAVAVLGFDCRRALDALGQFTALPGRGGRRHIPLARGQGEIVLIDESYNASPASMRAALQVLGDAWQAKRRIAILGDMRELGVQADALHADLAEDIRAAGIDKVFLCGSHMAHLWRRLPENIRAAYGAQSVDLAEPVRAAVQGGDWVLVKGSLGSAMAPLAKTIEELGDAV